MANRFTIRTVRPALVAAAVTATVLVAPTLASAAPTAPRQQPSIADVQKQLGQLALQNTQLVEQYDHARVAVTQRQKAAVAAKAAAAKADQQFRAANVEFARNVQAQYQSGGLGVAGALLDSTDGRNYIDQLDTLSMMSAYDAGIVHRVLLTKKTAARQAQQAQKLLASATSARDAVASKRTTVTQQIAKYRRLLATLNSQQRAAYQRSANPSVRNFTPGKLPTATSASAKRAVQFALDQVGEPYVFGAAGPDSWDCSGLTMAAWQHGGVSLPHSAADQYNYGTHVSLDQLSPGDLIFMYQPIGHVTIYIGDGMMVSAPTEGQDVTVVPVDSFSSDIVGATHLG